MLLPKVKTPHEKESIQRQIDAFVYELYGLSEDEIRRRKWESE